MANDYSNNNIDVDDSVFFIQRGYNKFQTGLVTKVTEYKFAIAIEGDTDCKTHRNHCDVIKDMRMVVCDKAETCKFARQEREQGCACGATNPHHPQSCEPCPFDGEAKCIPFVPKIHSSTTYED